MASETTVLDFERLYRETAGDLFGYVRRRTSVDAEDLVAETYAVAWRRRADLPAPMLRRAWLFGVARTLLAAQGRVRAAQVEAVQELGRASAHRHDAVADHPTEGAGLAAVREAMARLTAGEQEILRLVEWERLTPAELAVALGVRPGTARVRLHRARQALAADAGLRAWLAAPRGRETSSLRGLPPSEAPAGV